jgi:hypothetical protein
MRAAHPPPIPPVSTATPPGLKCWKKNLKKYLANVVAFLQRGLHVPSSPRHFTDGMHKNGLVLSKLTAATSILSPLFLICDFVVVLVVVTSASCFVRRCLLLFAQFPVTQLELPAAAPGRLQLRQVRLVDVAAHVVAGA